LYLLKLINLLILNGYGFRRAPVATVSSTRVCPQIFEISVSPSFCKDGEMETPAFFIYFVWVVLDVFEIFNNQIIN
jgi:hypothetical protein